MRFVKLRAGSVSVAVDALRLGALACLPLVHEESFVAGDRVGADDGAA